MASASAGRKFTLHPPSLGNRPYTEDMVRRMLTSPLYRGLTRYGAETRPGRHTAIIDEHLFAKVQRVLQRRSRDCGDKGSQFFLLRGLLVCSRCNRRLTGENHPKGSYYRCLSVRGTALCPFRYAPVKALDAQVEAMLPRMALPSAVRDVVVARLDATLAAHDETRQREQSRLASQLETVEAKLVQLADRLVSGLVSEETYRRLQAGYAADRDTTKARLAEVSGDLADAVEGVKRFLGQATAIETAYHLARTPDTKRDVLFAVIDQLVVTDRTISGVVYKSPFHLLLGDTHAEGSRTVLTEDQLQELPAGDCCKSDERNAP